MYYFLIPITLSAIGCSGKKKQLLITPADTVTTTTSTTIPEFTITPTLPFRVVLRGLQLLILAVKSY